MVHANVILQLLDFGNRFQRAKLRRECGADLKARNFGGRRLLDNRFRRGRSGKRRRNRRWNGRGLSDRRNLRRCWLGRRCLRNPVLRG